MLLRKDVAELSPVSRYRDDVTQRQRAEEIPTKAGMVPGPPSRL